VERASAVVMRGPRPASRRLGGLVVRSEDRRAGRMEIFSADAIQLPLPVRERWTA